MSGHDDIPPIIGVNQTETTPLGTNGGGGSTVKDAVRMIVAYTFAVALTCVGLVLASYQFFNLTFLDEYLVVQNGAARSSVGMFGMLIFGIGFALLLVQFFAEDLSVTWKGITFAGTLAALLIFMWIVRAFLPDTSGDSEATILDLNTQLEIAQDDIDELRTQHASFVENFSAAKDLLLTINCERSVVTDQDQAQDSAPLLAISSPAGPDKERIEEIRNVALEDANSRDWIMSSDTSDTEYPHLKADLIFKAEEFGNQLSFFVPRLLTSSPSGIVVQWVEARPLDGSSIGSHSTLMSFKIRNPDNFASQRQVVEADLQFANLANFCNLARG